MAGAACGGLMAEEMARIRMGVGWWVALLSAVWCIYTGDHLLDARREPAQGEGFRRAFHRRHARVLSIAIAFAITIGLAAASTLAAPVRLLGLGVSLLALAYLASAQGLFFASLPKEPIAGLLYAAGIWGGPILMSEGSPAWLVLAAALQGLAAILNLAMFGVFEAEADRIAGHRSLALSLGRTATTRAALFAAAIGAPISASLALMAGHHALVWAVLAVQIATPAGLLLSRKWSEKEERYRLWGDSVFLLGAAPRLLG